MVTPSDVMAAVDDIMSQPWQWGVSDCTASACDVFNRLHGIDPMKPLRGTYHDARSGYRLIRQWGGMLEMGARLAEMAGLRPGYGEPGDIGVSFARACSGPNGRSALICVQPGIWAGKTEDGYAILTAAERCWRA